LAMARWGPTRTLGPHAHHETQHPHYGWSHFRANHALSRVTSTFVGGPDHLAPLLSFVDDEFAEICGRSALRDVIARLSTINRLSSRSSPGPPRQRRLVIAAVDALLLDQPAAIELHAEIVIEAHGVERPGVRGKPLHYFPIGAHRNPVRGTLERYV